MSATAWFLIITSCAVAFGLLLAAAYVENRRDDRGAHAPRRHPSGGATLARLRGHLEHARSRAGTIPSSPAAVADAPAPAAGDVPGRDTPAAGLPPDDAAGSAPVAAAGAHPAGDPITHAGPWDGHADVHAFPPDEEVA